MKPASTKLEKGQSLVLVALLMIVMMAMLALVLDGGYAYAQRRAAQTAADAGALAGARELCIGAKETRTTRAINAARDYAINHNRATNAIVPTPSGGLVTVTAQISFKTIFASILGQPTMNVAAIAQAGCFVPDAGTGILPVAWSCRDPVGGFESDKDDCAIQFMDHGDLPDDGVCTVGEDPVYMIVDSKSLSEDVYCQDPPNSKSPVGALDCDINDDDENDLNLLSGGNRSWLDLDGGGGGAADLKSWIQFGFPDEFTTHTWVAGQTGADASVYGTVADYQLDKDVVLPVFDHYCSGLPASNCTSDYHPNVDYPDDEDKTVITGGKSTDYFHIISFSLFHVTCVQAQEDKNCPGHKKSGLDKNVKTIEGCFVEGFVPGLSGKPDDGIDVGAYTLYLTE